MNDGGPGHWDDEILVRLAVIESKLDSFLARAIDHESRIRALERKLWTATGAAAGAASFVTYILGSVKK